MKIKRELLLGVALAGMGGFLALAPAQVVAQNTVATANRLGCSRRTVERKVSRAETLLGYPLRERPAELLVALRLASLLGPGEGAPARRPTSALAAGP